MEEKRIIKLKGGIYNVFLIGLLLIMIFSEIGWQTESTLNGHVSTKEQVPLTSESWYTGKYQESKSDYFNSNFAFRSGFVRVYNQVNYSLHSKISAKDVVKGKDNMLFEIDYIETCYGKDYVGKDKIQEKLIKLQKVNDTLKKLNKELIIAIAPGKGYYYDEYIPDKYNSLQKGMTNYTGYAEVLYKSNLHFIDYQKWFKEMKDTTSYPLFSKTGTHWTVYGAYLATDSLLGFIRAKTSFKISRMIKDELFISETTLETDDDIERSMNLLFDIKDFSPFAYRRWHKEESKNERNPKMMIVGDSFWSVFGWALAKNFFKNGKFCFYGMEYHTLGESNVVPIGNLDLKTEFESNDIILIFQTDSNLNDLGFGVIEKLYDLYFKK
jgi:hypothetical protein